MAVTVPAIRCPIPDNREEEKKAVPPCHGLQIMVEWRERYLDGFIKGPGQQIMLKPRVR